LSDSVSKEAAAATLPPIPANGSTPVIIAYYFYGEGCSHCDEIEPYLRQVQAQYLNLDLLTYEVYHNETNQKKFSEMNTAFGINAPGVPSVFIGTHALVGTEEIQNQLEPAIVEEERIGTAGPVPGIPGNGSVAGQCPAPSGTLTVPLIVGCALIDSINPCAFTVLILLLLSIISLQSRRQVLMVGAVYIVAVFFFYLLSGIGLFSFVHLSGISDLIAMAAAAVAIILGLVNVIDALRKREGFILAIPESKKPVIDRYIRTATLPAAFVLGVLVGIFELPCTGGIYLAILGLMSNTLTLTQGLPYLLLYNFIFILPLIVILLIVVFGIPPERVNSWRLNNRRMLRLLVGIAMILVGVIILAAPRFL
jgi:cytochrome c biogenesis protein CcdA/thiol-disulfide isomerase/thioredoxin